MEAADEQYLLERNIPLGLVQECQAIAPSLPSARRLFVHSRTGKRFRSIHSLAEFLSSPLQRWLVSIASLPDLELKRQAQLYHELGYVICRQALSPTAIDELLNGHAAVGEESPNPGKRPRLCRAKSHQWLGAKQCIKMHRQESGLGVLAERGRGRYDLPLPHFLLRQVLAHLGSLWPLIQALLPKGSVKTANVMLSAPGSSRQDKHTDSSGNKTGPPHYLTVLIPLTEQDKHTGMTQLWPKSHHAPLAKEEGSPICPTLAVGDALVFDGLLHHLGTENATKDRDRYFFYLAYSTKRTDPNMQLTREW
ncbi:hypothetical protein BASA81_008453 [Batrachochytrium salamandrivorans]|nr:hypothetical protein BASA81_008453 [Batrachochytrium salamandrivorans]